MREHKKNELRSQPGVASQEEALESSVASNHSLGDFTRKGAKGYTLYDSVTNQGKITEKKAKNPRTQKTGTKCDVHWTARRPSA